MYVHNKTGASDTLEFLPDKGAGGGAADHTGWKLEREIFHNISLDLLDFEWYDHIAYFSKPNYIKILRRESPPNRLESMDLESVSLTSLNTQSIFSCQTLEELPTALYINFKFINLAFTALMIWPFPAFSLCLLF